MRRSALFVALMVSTLLGPTLCCCAAARFLTVSPAASTDLITQQESPAQPACPFCRQEAPPEPNPASAPSEPVQPICPCCDGKVLLTYVAEALPAPVIPDVLVLGIIAATPDPLAAFANNSHMREHPAGVGTQSFLIDLCHRLRC